jgi:hypothetical protein
MNLLNQLLHDPPSVRRWDVERWNRFLPLARRARILGRCYRLFEQHGLLEVVPGRLQDQMQGALVQTRYVQTQALRELRQVGRVMNQAGIPLMALKGVAYLVASLPPHRWRSLSDIDLLVREQDIDRAERALQQSGWAPSGEFDSYDRHYYRDWMHEVPPLLHHSRETEVDIHHNLAPPVSRIRINAALLWDRSIGVTDPNGQSVRILGPADLLLHNAVHLFMNDELRGGLRDVVDFRDLFEHFLQQDNGFDRDLLVRARELGCGRPLYYAVSSAQRLAGLAPASGFLNEVERYAPAYPVGRFMAWLIEQALAPQRLGLKRSVFANQLLFVRSHWIRMPPGMLLRHLLHKGFRSKKKPEVTAADLPG